MFGGRQICIFKHLDADVPFEKVLFCSLHPPKYNGVTRRSYLNVKHKKKKKDVLNDLKIYAKQNA